MELWKETINKVYLDGESTWTPTATYTKNGVTGGTLSPVWNVTDLRWEAILPYILEECTVAVTWNFTVSGAGPITKVDTYEFVTPYVTLSEIREALGTMPVMTDAQLRRAERKIRGVINNFTGQEFGRFTGAYRIQATGDDNLKLPRRLISFTGVVGADFTDISYYGTRGDGWYLGRSAPVYDDGSYTSSGVIRYPGSSWRCLWKDNVWYTISGEWGYEDVPGDVKEAALILIEDLICPDSEYRDRYIDSVKTADYQYMYNSGAFRGTGSVIADQLLEQYRRTPLVVI